MGTLGEYLRQAREAKEVDLRDAAQQTRISLQYLKALENEDFTKLPGEVFVRGFLKNYCRFLNLDEAEVMKRYSQLKPQAAPATVSTSKGEESFAPDENNKQRQTPLEPFIWGAVIVFSLIAFLFSSLPAKHPKEIQPQALSMTSDIQSRETATVPAVNMSKLYLKVVALEDTWLLIRTDGSPQKKAVLKRGESLTWSADERFLLSYSRVGAVQILLNGAELAVQGEPESPVRDLAIARNGIVKQPFSARSTELQRKKHNPAPESISPPVPAPKPAATTEQKPTPGGELKPEQHHTAGEAMPQQAPPVPTVEAPVPSATSPSPSNQTEPHEQPIPQ